jgi:cytochrome c biogenesis protein CcdA
MGLTSGMACPARRLVLGTLLVFGKKAVVTGGLLLFTFSMGLSTMLLVIGFSPARSCQTGRMVKVKTILAC